MADKKEQEAIEYSTQQIESYKFRRLHPEFYASAKNVKAISDELVRRKLSWRLKNLELVYKSLSNNCALEPDPKTVEEVPEEEIVTEPVKPWGTLTKETVVNMDRETYRRFYKDFPEFRSEVSALAIAKGYK